MASAIDIGAGALDSAIATLIDYLSFHVILCLVPAFFIAGAMAVFIPQETVMKYIGPEAKPYVAYPAAATAGLLLAVCSCTVLPLFVGIYKKGAGLGPAMTFLFSAPAVNILALTYTGTLIGMDIAVARAALAFAFAMVIGVLMAGIFRNSPNPYLSSPTPSNNPASVATSNPVNISIAEGSAEQRNRMLMDSKQVIEAGVIVLIILSGILMALLEIQGLLLGLYVLGTASLIALTVISKQRGIVLFAWLVYMLLVGTSRIAPFTDDIALWELIIDPQVSNVLFKGILVGILAFGAIIHADQSLDPDDIDQWMAETWFFIKTIFPLIIVGVFIAGGIKYFVPEDVVVSLVGQNTLVANLLAVFFGVFMYFPTLMEVPIARTFLDLGMARGPLLAYLLADPELSIQSILVTRRFIGDKKNSVYVVLVAILTTIAGLFFGLMIGEGVAII